MQWGHPNMAASWHYFCLYFFLLMVAHQWPAHCWWGGRSVGQEWIRARQWWAAASALTVFGGRPSSIDFIYFAKIQVLLIPSLVILLGVSSYFESTTRTTIFSKLEV